MAASHTIKWNVQGNGVSQWPFNSRALDYKVWHITSQLEHTSRPSQAVLQGPHMHVCTCGGTRTRSCLVPVPFLMAYCPDPSPLTCKPGKDVLFANFHVIPFVHYNRDYNWRPSISNVTSETIHISHYHHSHVQFVNAQAHIYVLKDISEVVPDNSIILNFFNNANVSLIP
jgi:hypothetical protein